jgi:acyl carrier protein
VVLGGWGRIGAFDGKSQGIATYTSSSTAHAAASQARGQRLLTLASALTSMNVTNPTSTIDPEEIRKILVAHGRLSTSDLGEQDDLYRAGLTSLATVGVMLALEERFDVEFPESALGRDTFRSIRSIAETIKRLSP